MDSPPDPDQEPKKRRGNPNWVKGKSANPKGRPPSLAAMVRAETHDGAKIIRRMSDIAFGRITAPMREQVDAMKWLAERGYGKSPEVVMNLTSDDLDGSSALPEGALSELLSALAPSDVVEGELVGPDPASIEALATGLATDSPPGDANPPYLLTNLETDGVKQP